MNDGLDKMSDSDLSVAFAIQVAGWYYFNAGWRNSDDEACESPRFSTSADAVMPWLEGNFYSVAFDPDEGYKITVVQNHWPKEPIITEGTSPTFARAACIALIRAKRALKGAA